MFSRDFFINCFILLSVNLLTTASEKVLATVPNLNVLLNDVFFMEVVRPQSISYTYKIRPAKDFGRRFPHRYTNIELAVAEPYHGCSVISNSWMLQDKIVLLQRGECSFVTKSLHAQEAGAFGVIIADNDLQNDKAFVDMVDDNTDRTVDIPAFFLLGKDGHMIHSTLHAMELPYAVINIPINMTGAAVHNVKQPPWTLW